MSNLFLACRRSSGGICFEFTVFLNSICPINNEPSTSPIQIVWFRLDLRLTDNPALAAAARSGRPVIPVFIYAPEEEAPWAPGAASRWWLHQSLRSLDLELQEIGSRLVLRRGPTLAALQQMLKSTGARSVFWNRRYEPSLVARDREVEHGLRGAGVDVETFNSALLREPWTVANQAGNPFQVFTPFWRHCLGQADPAVPTGRARALPTPARWPKSLPLPALELEPRINWAEGLRSAWTPGEAGAQKWLEQFLASAFVDYGTNRNRPDLQGTSRLSPHLHFGELGPGQVWHGVRRMALQQNLPEHAWRGSQFLAELGWREFAHHLLHHFPRTPTEPLREQFRQFPWRKPAASLKAWQRGRTGYPIVDAGMRELWTTGWMHNRVRMLVASFLVKDLLISWTEGARWFWDTLVDADLAQNTLGWQWSAGCGADAAPYFRIFNPITQGEQFDPGGDYVRRWCPELANLPARWVHRPAQAPPEVLKQAGVELGRNYAEPIVSHFSARETALKAFANLKQPAGKQRP